MLLIYFLGRFPIPLVSIQNGWKLVDTSESEKFLQSHVCNNKDKITHPSHDSRTRNKECLGTFVLLDEDG